ncbi:MAG: peptidoglycan-binding domain-containing protein [Butyricicoccaceae bacterium]
MLSEIAPHYNRIAAVPLTGEYDSDTQVAVRRAQQIFQLPQTGLTDRATWQALAGLHNALFRRTPLGWSMKEWRIEEWRRDRRWGIAISSQLFTLHSFPS